jgi:hypothetical protein
MSDFSAMEQSFALPAMTPEQGAHAVPAPFPQVPARLDVAADELWLHGLKSPREMADIMHLRRQIQLPAHVLADPGFAVLEKKETNRASSRPCAGATPPSAH